MLDILAGEQGAEQGEETGMMGGTKETRRASMSMVIVSSKYSHKGS